MEGTDLSGGEWIGTMDKTDERTLQWFAVNLMTHKLQKEWLVGDSAVIVSSNMVNILVNVVIGLLLKSS